MARIGSVERPSAVGNQSPRFVVDGNRDPAFHQSTLAVISDSESADGRRHDTALDRVRVRRIEVQSEVQRRVRDAFFLTSSSLCGPPAGWAEALPSALCSRWAASRIEQPSMAATKSSTLPPAPQAKQ